MKNIIISILYILYRLRVYLFPQRGNFGTLNHLVTKQKFPSKNMLVRVTRHDSSKVTALFVWKDQRFYTNHSTKRIRGEWKRTPGLKPLTINKIVSWKELPLPKKRAR